MHHSAHPWQSQDPGSGQLQTPENSSGQAQLKDKTRSFHRTTCHHAQMMSLLKCKKLLEPEVVDFYKLGKEIQNRSGSSIGADLTKDRRFRGYGGRGAAVALITWNLVSQNGLLLEHSMILHLLWALHFVKTCLKQDARSSAVGGSTGAIDANT